MTGRTPARLRAFATAAAVCLAGLAATATAASAETEVVYDNLATPVPANVVSLGYQATQTGQFGGAIELAGADRKGGTVTVGMSSWACEKGAWGGAPECLTEAGAKFEWPVTLNINEVGPGETVGALLKSVTRTFRMPYRPSESRLKCTNSHGEPTGAWYQSATKTCFHGKYFRITFGVGRFVWPAKAIVSISYNTSNYGLEPQAPKACDSEPQGCPYDSLNVGLTELPQAPSIGSVPNQNNAYQNSTTPSNYCDGGLGGTGIFRLDAGCWEDFQPLLEVKATP